MLENLEWGGLKRPIRLRWKRTSGYPHTVWEGRDKKHAVTLRWIAGPEYWEADINDCGRFVCRHFTHPDSTIVKRMVEENYLNAH